MKSRFTTKFIYIFSILVILLLSLNNVFATPRSITNNFIRLIDFQNSGVDLYISNESLEQDLSRGDFNLKLFFDGRLLLRGKQYPQNIKIEIYTLTEGKKSFVSILNRTIKNNKAAENIFLITKLPRIIESTELYFDIYDANNILKATYTTNITVNTSEISKSESIDDYDCQEGDGECLIEYILRNLSFSASYDRNLKTEVVKNTKGRYTVSIPVKKGNTLKSKVREIGSSSGGGKTNGIGSNKLADPYPYFQNDVEVASTYWDEVRDSLKIKFANSNNEFNFKRDGSLQLSTNIDNGFLNIAAGTENKAPIVFTQGELLTDLVEGALEYDGSNLYFTKGGVRNILGAGSGIPGPVGPAGAQGPAGPAGSSSGIDLSNGGFLNGSISFTGSSFIQDAVFNGSFQFKTAAQNGFVLTSDANGNATWTSFTTLPGAGDITSVGDCLTGACNNFTLTAASTGTIPLSIRGAAGQTANLTQWQNSSGVVSALITNNGEFSNSGKGSGTGNEFFGKNAGSSITLGSDNIAFGNNALNTATDSTTNIAIGTNALARTTRGSSNIAIGYQALYGSTTSISQRDNVAIGNHVLYNAIGVEDSVIIGDRAGYRITGADFNTFLGHEVNLGVAVGATGSSNIFIGHQAAYDETGDDTLIIDNRNRGSENNGRTMSLVYGKFNGDPANQTITFNANTGIGFTTPPHKLSVNGSVMIKDGTQATGYILTSDANGFASWQAPSAGDISSVGNCLSGSCNGFTLTADTTATTPLVLEARAGQTANLTQWQNNTGTVISRINNTGEFTATNQITLLDPDGNIVIRTPTTSGTGYGIGLNSVSAGFGSVAVLGTASGQRSTSVGGASAGGNDSVAVGVTASASSVNMVAIGREAGSISGGYNGGAGSILLGYQSQASANEFGISHNVNKESFWYNFGGFQGIQRIADFSFSAPVANSRTDYEGLLNFRVFENQNPLTAMSLRAFNGTTISTINGQLIYKNGTQANGYVLASDANGLATWQDPLALLGGGPIGDITSVGNCLSGACNGFTLTADTAATTPLAVRAAVGQTANLQEWQNGGGTTIASIGSFGGAVFSDTVRVPSSWGLPTNNLQFGTINPAGIGSNFGDLTFRINGINAASVATDFGFRLHSSSKLTWRNTDTTGGIQLVGLSPQSNLLKVESSNGILGGIKTGASIFNGSLTIADGTQTNGYVLTSDANGLATWQDPSSLLSSGASASGIAGAIQFSDGSNGFSSDANNLFWNSSTNRLRIGNHTPAINAPLQVQVDGAGTGFNIQFSPTEHTRFVSGGTFKGLMGSGSVPMVLFNSGEVRLMPGGIQTVTAAVSGGVGINNINPNSMLAIDINSSSQQGLILKAASMQTANFTEWKDFNGNLLANISNEGSATFRGAYGALAFRTINSGATSFSVTNSGGNPRSTVTNGVWTIGEHPDAANLINAHGRFVQKSGGISRIATGTFAGPTVFQVMSNHGSSKSGSLSIEFASNIGGSVVSTSNGSVNAAIRNNLDGDIRFSVAKNIASNGSAANLEEVVSITNGGNMGIGFTNPMSILDINGSLAMRDGTQADGYVLTSDANGLASWQNIFTVINGGTFSDRVILSTVALSGGNMRFGVIENGVDTFGWQDINNGRLVLKAKAPHAQTLTITPRGNGGTVPTLESSTGQIFLMPTAGGNQYNGFEFSNIGLNIRNQMTPQRILLANYWSSASGGINHEYSYIGWINNTFHIETVNGGTGVTRNIMFSAPVTTINGSIAIRDGTQAAGRVLTSDANGSASWQANTSRLASGIAGAIQFSDGSNGFNSNATNFFWNNITGSLGIGTNVPNAPLTISKPTTIANQKFFSVTANGNEIASLQEGILPNYGGTLALKDAAGAGDYVRIRYDAGFPKVDTNRTSLTFQTATTQQRLTSTYIDFTMGAQTPLIMQTAGPTATFTSTNGTHEVLIVRGASSQNNNLTEWQNGGGAVLSYFNRNGQLLFSNQGTYDQLVRFGSGYLRNDGVVVGSSLAIETGEQPTINSNEFRVGDTYRMGWTSTSGISGVLDTYFTRESAAIIQVGNDSIAAVNYTFKPGDGLGTDIAGASLTFAAGRSTGSAVGGDLIFQTSNGSTSGASQNILDERMRITDTGEIGIGESNPQRALHINDVMRLEPRSTAPTAPATGDIYIDSDGSQAACVYLNGAWVVMAGAGSCS